MAVKTILFLCAQVLLIQSVFSQVCSSRAAIDASGFASPYGFAGSAFAPGFAYDGFTAPCAFDGLAGPLAYDGLTYPGFAYDGIFAPAMEFTATSGGGLPVTSSSPIAPVGISIVSENVFEGALLVSGELPFVGTTAMEGVLPTAGAGAINHGCGNGINAMSALSATSSPASVATAAGPAYALGLGYNGLMAPGIGASAFAFDGLMAPGFAAPLAYDNFAFDASCAGRGLGYDGLVYGSPYDAFEIVPTSGGALPVSSASAVPPTGIAVASENAYEGALAVGGELPFVGTVAMEGRLPTAGAGAVNHACGNGRNAMISESAAYGAGAIAPAAFAGVPAAAFVGSPALGYRGGLAGRGCGCAL